MTIHASNPNNDASNPVGKGTALVPFLGHDPNTAVPQRGRQGLTAFALKLAAILGMTANHVAHAFLSQLPVAAAEGLYWLGGLTFPIMAFLLIEGYRHTSSLPRYLARLLIFAALAQIPFTLLFGWTANVLFTLAIGLGLIWFRDTVPNPLARAAALLAALTVSLICDWAVLGPLMIYLFHILRGRPNAILLTVAVPYAALVIPAAGILIATVLSPETGIANAAGAANATGFLVSFEAITDACRLAGLPLDVASTLMHQVCELGYALVGFTLACVLMLSYNGRRGRSFKWAFYAYYPLHLFVIWLLTLLL